MNNEQDPDIIRLTFQLYGNYILSVNEIAMLLNKKSIEYVIKESIYNVLVCIDYEAETLFDEIDIINILEKNDLQEIDDKIIKPLKALMDRLNKDYNGLYADSTNRIINIINNKEKIKKECNIIYEK